MTLTGLLDRTSEIIRYSIIRKKDKENFWKTNFQNPPSDQTILSNAIIKSHLISTGKLCAGKHAA